MGGPTVEVRVEPNQGVTGRRKRRYRRGWRRGVEDGVNTSGGHTIGASKDDEVCARTPPSDGELEATIHDIWRLEDEHDDMLVGTQVVAREFMWDWNEALLCGMATWPGMWSVSS